jgi:RNA polymerase sigma-70 factor, ECF subfamily
MMSRRSGARLRVVRATDVQTAPESGASPPSFHEIYRHHAGYVAGLAGRILGRNHEVPDVVQDVFLIVHRRLATLRDAGAMRAWLGRITVREASKRLRWRRLRLFIDPAGTIDADLVADEQVPELRPLIALLYVTLDRLPTRDRIAWVLRHLLDEPLDGVAALCACSLATAKRRIASAETVLRPILAPLDATLANERMR